LNQSVEGPHRPVSGVVNRIAAAAVATEALVLVAVAVRLVVELTSADPADPGGAAVEAVLCIGFAAGLLGCAWAVLRGRRWPRGLLLTWQLLQVAVAIPALRDAWYIGAGLILLSAVVIVTLVRMPAPESGHTAG
jgi:hypothetical protein